MSDDSHEHSNSKCEYERLRDDVIDLLIARRGRSAYAHEVFAMARELRERRDHENGIIAEALTMLHPDGVPKCEQRAFVDDRKCACKNNAVHGRCSMCGGWN